jgi:APA family basic amino acid/polyamine antiporter
VTPIGDVLAASALLFFAYPGYARITTMAEEIRVPHRTIPLGVLLALGISVVIYVLVATAALLLVGPETLAHSTAPLVAASSVSGLVWVAVVMAVGGVIATGSVFLVDLTGVSRVILAMARHNDVPGFLCEVDPRRGVPGRAIIAAGVVISLFVLFVDLSALIAATSLALLWYYVLMNASALRLGRARPFPAIVPLFGMLSCLLLTFFLPLNTLLLGICIVVVSSVAYYLKARL